MLSPKSDKFLKDILSYVKFSFDRYDIRLELEDHISEKVDYYMEQGYDMEKAEQLSINDMGDAKEIGIELNKQHYPILGWLWKITNVTVGLAVILSIFFIGIPTLNSLFPRNLINDIPKSNIAYKIDVDKKVKIDDMVIRFTNVVYEKNGDMDIFYEYYDTKLWGMGWSLGSIGKITDNLGNTYMSGSGSVSGGIKSKGRVTVDNFSKEADILIISYDSYNRKYRVEIPLKAGDNNE
ncbi:MAG: permease prefix domain 1-containing protein [Bacillota bacterium]|nr:permease prefix domain 1-containing protein [Bacillota bacterium]